MFTDSTRRGKKPDIWPDDEPIPASYSQKVEDANVSPGAAADKLKAAATALVADATEQLGNYLGA